MNKKKKKKKKKRTLIHTGSLVYSRALERILVVDERKYRHALYAMHY